METQESVPSREAPDPASAGRTRNDGAGRVTGKQWMAICCVICLLIALFLFMHGGEF